MFMNIPYADILALYDRARMAADRFVRLAAAADLSIPTPCEGWDLRDLLTHVVEENHRFAAAASAAPSSAAAFDDDGLTAAWDVSATALREAFGRADPAAPAHLDGVPDLTVDLALRMQLLDTVVHTWDVARTLGREHHPADDLVAFVGGFAAAIAQRSPAGTPGVFAAPRPAAGEDTWARALADVGRTL